MNREQVLYALRSDLAVYWCNTDFKVFENNGNLYVEFKHNDNINLLNDSEIWQCFIL